GPARAAARAAGATARRAARDQVAARGSAPPKGRLAGSARRRWARRHSPPPSHGGTQDIRLLAKRSPRIDKRGGGGLPRLLGVPGRGEGTMTFRTRRAVILAPAVGITRAAPRIAVDGEHARALGAADISSAGPA